MSKSMAEIARHPGRFGALAAIAVAVALLALLIARIDTGAVHNEGMLEMDGNVAYDGGDGFAPGTGRCGFPYPTAGPSPVDCIIDPAPTGSPPVDSPGAAFDWADVCDRTVGGDLDGYITEAASLPTLPSGSSIGDLICQADFIQGATDDISYHTGSDKDYQEIFDGSSADWGCRDSSNATSKTDLLNAYFIVATVEEADGPHQVIYIGAERDVETGSVFNGYWILQDDVGVPPNATTDGQLDCTAAGLPVPCTTTTAPCDFSGQHFCGDVLIRFNYDNGGRIGSVRANEWVAPSPDFVGTFNPTNGCDQLAGGGAACPAGSPGPVDDCDDDGNDDAIDNCTAAQQASAESHTVPGGFLCDRPPAQGDCRAASDQTAPGDDLCGRVNGETDCTIAPKQNDPNPPPCSGPGCFSTEWEPGDSSCPTKPSGSGGVAPPTFSEMGIDLTGLNLELPCIATMIAESRSSPSIDATLKDFVPAPTGAECTSSIETDIHSGSRNATEPPPHTVLTDCTQGTTPPSCGTTGTVTAGTTVHDAAFLTLGGPGGTAGGTLTFTRYSSINCAAGTGTDETPINISQAIGTTRRYESADFPTVAGSTGISFTATYSGDPNAKIPGSTSICEPLNVINPSMAFDKDAAPVATVTYTYQLDNTGDSELNTVTVTDDKCSPAFVSGDTDGDNKLDTDELWNFACSTPISLTSGVALVNTAKANAKDPLGNSLSELVDVVTTTATLTVSDPNGE